ncbi:cation:proton antiporter [Streptomyces sp. NPDC048172]|uniref:cation:proton antiporter n=1 Tax=Streptomyces sp. NPDC048172 TaxID=3365505 RepID=UPI0037233B71
MTTERVLAGMGLVVVLAVGAQVLAGLLRIPAIIVLLPVGFAAGALTDVVHPDELVGPAFSPLVSLAVAVILYEAGIGLDLRRLTGDARRVVIRLVWIGALLTPVLAALVAAPLLGMSPSAAVMLGVVLVVSGPTVVGPLLRFVRPSERVRRILVWESSLVDAVGGILGALVFHAVTTKTRDGPVRAVAEFLASAGTGLAGGVCGTALLVLLLHRMRPGEVLGAAVQLATVVGVAAACDLVREDTGLIAAIVMGIAVASLPCFDAPALRPFFETLVSLIVGLLFVSISATVTPASLRGVVLPALVLVAVLVAVVRPLVAALSAAGTGLPRGERAFLGWMAPRGIVAASTASTFAAGLVERSVRGAEKILPATFLVIVVTVTLYGLTAGPVARRLRVTRAGRERPLLVGDEPWVVDLGLALRSTGIEALLWSGSERQRERVASAGLELAPGELLASAAGPGAELEGVTAVYLLTGEDDFNALAAAVLSGGEELPVHRLAPREEGQGVVAPYLGGPTLFGAGLSGAEVARRYEAGERIVVRAAAGGAARTGYEPLFHVDPAGNLAPFPGPAPTTGHVLLLGPTE